MLYFSERPEKVSVLRYDPVPAKQETEASEEKETTETEENHETEEQGETVEVSEEKDDKGKKQFILKNLSEKGIYLVKAEFSQGTVEYGFEVK